MYSLIIADDEPEILAGLCAIVRWSDLGFELKAAFPDGDSALAYLKCHDADALLCDIVMNETSGLDLARYLRDHKPKTRVVLVSAYSDFEYARQAIEARVFHYLLKPTRIDKLTAVFRVLKSELDEERRLPPDPPNEYEKRVDSYIVRKVCAYVDEHLAENVTLQDVAQFLHYNASYLSRVFKAENGEGFNDYVNRAKVERAKALLSGDRMKVYEVAEAVGFKDIRYFSKIFVSVAGKTPSEYRKEHA